MNRLMILDNGYEAIRLNPHSHSRFLFCLIIGDCLIHWSFTFCTEFFIVGRDSYCKDNLHSPIFFSSLRRIVGCQRSMLAEAHG